MIVILCRMFCIAWMFSSTLWIEGLVEMSVNRKGDMEKSTNLEVVEKQENQ